MSGRAPILWLIVGFGVWSLAFVALYALQAVGCAAGWNLVRIGPTDLHRIVLIAAFVLSLAGIGVVLVLQYRRREFGNEPATRFLHGAGIAASLSAALVSVLVFSPVLGLSTCR